MADMLPERSTARTISIPSDFARIVSRPFRGLASPAIRKTPAAAMAELTDIVRHFLEEQYHLRAERQTTGEFLRELNRADSPVTESDRKFLRSFLEAADMVKFARFTADSDIFENAAFRAEKLIAGPGPDPLEGGEKRS